jgi:hypothetical protein
MEMQEAKSGRTSNGRLNRAHVTFSRKAHSEFQGATTHGYKYKIQLITGAGPASALR